MAEKAKQAGEEMKLVGLPFRWLPKQERVVDCVPQVDCRLDAASQVGSDDVVNINAAVRAGLLSFGDKEKPHNTGVVCSATNRIEEHEGRGKNVMHRWQSGSGRNVFLRHFETP